MGCRENQCQPESVLFCEETISLSPLLAKCCRCSAALLLAILIGLILTETGTLLLKTLYQAKLGAPGILVARNEIKKKI